MKEQIAKEIWKLDWNAKNLIFSTFYTCKKKNCKLVQKPNNIFFTGYDKYDEKKSSLKLLLVANSSISLVRFGICQYSYVFFCIGFFFFFVFDCFCFYSSLWKLTYWALELISERWESGPRRGGDFHIISANYVGTVRRLSSVLSNKNKIYRNLYTKMGIIYWQLGM